MSTITTVAELRALIGEEPPGLAEKNIDHIDLFAERFIEKCPFVVLSTSDEHGQLDASPKGDAPGFMCVKDSKTLLIPDRPGNKLAYGHLNVIANPRVGLLMMIPGTTETLRINGTAVLRSDAELCEELAARGKPAILVIEVTVEECFFHCSKAFIRSDLWKPERWDEVPHKVSFGELYAHRNNLGKEAAVALDEMIEADYQTNL